MMRSWMTSWMQQFGGRKKPARTTGRLTKGRAHRNMRLEPLEERHLLSVGTPELGSFHASGGASQFILDSNANGVWDAQDQTSIYGDAADTAVIGDWNGDGIDDIGVFRVSNGFGEFILDSNGSGAWDVNDAVYYYGDITDVPISGDWDNDGYDEVGVFRVSSGYGQFILDSNGNGVLDDTVYDYGEVGDVPVVGDWGGNGYDEIGVFRPSETAGSFVLDENGDFTETGDSSYAWGYAGDTPLVGDWNNDGSDEVGSYRASGAQGQFVLDSDGDFDETGEPVYSYCYAGETPLIGDWDGNGVDDIGNIRTYDGEGQFTLDYNGTNTLTSDDPVYAYGLAADTPISGDWNGDGREQIGVFRQVSGYGRFILDSNGDGSLDEDDTVVDYGFGSDTPLIGDWNGDGCDDVGLFRTIDGYGVFILDSNGNGAWDASDVVHYFGYGSDTPIVGDWDGDGCDQVGSFRPIDGSGIFVLDSNSDGIWDAEDVVCCYGYGSDTPLVADWNDDGTDDIGVYRNISGNGAFILDVDGSGEWEATDGFYYFGDGFDTPIVGDWNWKGADEVGLFFANNLLGQFTLDTNSNGYQDSEDQDYLYGDADDTPIVGDWNGDGRDEIGVFIDNSGYGQFVLDSNGDGVLDVDDTVYDYGNSVDTPIVGDWNGDGRDEIGVFVDNSGYGQFILDVDRNGVLDVTDAVCDYGLSTDIPIAGDTNGDGYDEIGVFRTSAGYGQFILDADGDGVLNDTVYDYGDATDTPLVGDWNGDGCDEIGVFQADGGNGVFLLDSNGNYASDATDTVYEYGLATDTPLVGDWDGAGVVFADPDVSAAVHHALAEPLGKRLTPDDMLLLTTLTVDSSLLTSLTGLEYARNLESLTLIPSDYAEPGDVSSLLPLCSMTELESLSLQGLGLEDGELDPLGSLESVGVLDLRYNEIDAIPATVAAMPALATLALHGNPLTDDPGAGLANLAGKAIDVDIAADHPEDAEDVADLADRLYNLPLLMYEYVLNTIEFEAYRGSMKGPEAVLQTGEANAWDTSLFLAELLEEAGIDVRYVHGVIELPVDSQATGGQGVESWLGVATPGAAIDVLDDAYLDAVNIYEGTEDNTVAVQFDHLWAEASLDVPGTGTQWVALDASIKFRDCQDSVRNMLAEVTFDTDPITGGYFATARTDSPYEYYEDLVRDYLAQNDPTTSIADIPYAGAIICQTIDVVPTSVPYDIVSQEAAIAAIPASETYRLTVTITNTSESTTYYQTVALSLPEVGTLPITVRPTPSGSYVIPELLLNWETDAESAYDFLAISNPVAFSPTVSLLLTLDYAFPEGVTASDVQVQYVRQAGKYMALALDANQLSQELIADQWRTLNEASIAYGNDSTSFDLDENIGYLLYLAGTSYMFEANAGEDVINNLTGATRSVSLPASGLVSSSTTFHDWTTSVYFGCEAIAFPYQPEEMLLDIAHNRWKAISIDDSTQYNATRFDILGQVNSAMEHLIWEELTNIASISTIKSMQLARERSIAIYELDSTNWDTLKGNLDHYSSLYDIVEDEVLSGSTVTIPASRTNLGDWVGVGYIVVRPSGSVGYMLNGLWDTSTDLTNGSATTDSPFDAFVNRINSFVQWCVGDPINTGNGSVSHVETDILFPGLGSSLEFTRQYHSALTGSDSTDWGLGEGWSFNYCDRLETTGIEDKIWYTATGDQYVFRAYGVFGYTVPDSLHGVFSYNGAGLGFTWTDETGAKVNFDASGRLSGREDRYGNGVSITYDASDHIQRVSDLQDSSRYLDFTYMGDHITSITDFTGRTWSYQYDANGRLATMTAPTDTSTPEAVVGYEYYTDTLRDGLLQSVTDPNGDETTFTYYANRRGFEVTDDSGQTQTVTYNTFRNRTAFSDEGGATTYYTYNGARVEPIAKLDFGTGTSLLESGYTRVANTTVYSSSTGRGWEAAVGGYSRSTGGSLLRDYNWTADATFLYDVPNGTYQVTVILGDEGAIRNDMAVVLEGLLVDVVTTAAGEHVWSSHTVVVNDGQLTLRLVDQTGDGTNVAINGLLITKLSDDTSFLSHAGGVIEELYPDQTTVEYTWGDSEITSVTDVFGQTESYLYDSNGNVTQITDRAGYVTTYTYTDYSNVATVTVHGDPSTTLDDQVTTYRYFTDALGNDCSLREIEDALGNITSYTYPTADRGLPDTVTTPRGNETTGDSDDFVTAFTYNTAGQIETMTTRVSATDSITFTFHYDARGNLDYAIDGEGNRTDYTYDLLNRLLSEQLPAIDGVRQENTNTYDAIGNLVESVVSATGATDQTAAFVYDDHQRVIKAVNVDGTYILNQYDGTGNLIAQIDEMGRVTRYRYDGMNRLVATIYPDGTSVRLSYNGGRVSRTIDAMGNVTEFEYDVLGRVTAETLPDPDGAGSLTSATTTYHYDAFGNLQYVVDPLGTGTGDTDHVTEYQYDALNQKTCVIQPDPDGAAGPLARPVTYYGYDENGNLAYVTDARGSAAEDAGHTTLYVYDEADRLIQEILPDPDGAGALGQYVTRYFYDDNGNVRFVVGPEGTDAQEAEYTTEYQYDALGRMVLEIFPDPDSDGSGADRSEVQYEYDLYGNLASVTDALGNTTVYHYNLRGLQTAVTDALGNTSMIVHDAAGNTLLVTDAAGAATRFEYDGMNRLVRVVAPVPEAGSTAPVTTYEYDANGNLTAVTDPRGNTTWYAYDAWNRQVAATDALGSEAGDASHTITTRYDQLGNVVEIVDQLGRTTNYAYDNLGRLIEEQSPQFETYDSQTVRATTYYGYDAVGNLKFVTGPGASSRLDTDYTTWYFYDTLGRETCVIDPRGQDFAENAIPDVAPTDPDYSVVSVYDAAGNLASVTSILTDATDQVVVYGYDNLGRVIRQSEGSIYGPTTAFAYDANGNLTSVTEGLLGSPSELAMMTRYVYDELNREIRTIDALGTGVDDLDHATLTTYDSLGRVASVTDSEGNTTSYRYDRLGRLVEETDALGNSSLYEYDASGNLAQKTDRNGRVVEYAYDAVNQLIEEVWLDSSSQAIYTISYYYDAAGQLGAVEDESVCYDYEYDALGNLTTTHIGTEPLATPTGDGLPYVADPLVQFDYGYDEAGYLRQVVESSTVVSGLGATTSYEYDSLGRVVRITQTGTGATDKRVDFAYRDDSSYATVTRYADLAGTIEVATSEYDYDDLGRLTDLTHLHGLTELADYTWAYDGANRITQMISVDGTSDLTYDDTSQLTSADHTYQTDESYAYDANGNRVTASGATYATGAGNRLLSDGTYYYLYDQEGNRIARFVDVNANSVLDAGDTDVTEYEWDYRNRLVKVTDRASYGAAADKIVEYTYDYLNRRFEKTVDTDGDGTPEEYLYNIQRGDELALELSDADGLDGTGYTPELSQRYLYGNVIDEILAVEDAAGDVLWGLADHEGTIRDIVDSTGTVQEHRQYDTFGQITSPATPTADFPQAFTGRPLDADTGLYDYRARWYDPAVGRFVSEDPSGFAGGDANLYRYAGNSPVIYVDPSGLSYEGVAGRSGASHRPGQGSASSGPSIGADDRSWLGRWVDEMRYRWLRREPVISDPRASRDVELNGRQYTIPNDNGGKVDWLLGNAYHRLGLGGLLEQAVRYHIDPFGESWRQAERVWDGATKLPRLPEIWEATPDYQKQDLVVQLLSTQAFLGAWMHFKSVRAPAPSRPSQPILAEVVDETPKTVTPGETFHGNDLRSTKPQHGYVIKKDGAIQEYGISGQKLNKNGTSPRARQKIRTKYAKDPSVSHEVLKKNMAGRQKGLNWETGKVRAYKKANPDNLQPPRQELPKVD